MSHLVVVDDDPDIRMLVDMAFAGAGFTVTQCDGGIGAVEKIAEVFAANPNDTAVVLDVQMAEVDGWQVLSGLRDKVGLATLPVIMCTVKSSSPDRERAMDLGAMDYMTKPFDVEQLRDRVSRALRIVSL